MMIQHFNIWKFVDRFQKSPFYLETGNVFMMYNPVFSMAAFSSQFEVAVFLFIKTGSPFYKFSEAMRTFFTTISTTFRLFSPSPARMVSSICFRNYLSKNQ